MRIVLALSLPFVLTVGCAHPKTQVKEASAAPSNGSLVKEQAVAPAASSTPDTKNDCGLVRVHFELNSAQIEDGDKPLLEQSAQCLKQDKQLHVTIEGNADERGTEEYNLALGDHRARAVATHLERLGASAAQLKTVSYGKEQPECTEHDEACWAKNRRAAIRPAAMR
jgi:peptidoglycan-associated lipoprotein